MTHRTTMFNRRNQANVARMAVVEARAQRQALTAGSLVLVLVISILVLTGTGSGYV